METTEKRRAFIINAMYFALAGAIVLAVCKYVVPWLMPFILGYIIALIFRPIAGFLAKRTGMNKKFAGFIVVVLGYAVIVLLLILLGTKLFSAGKRLARGLPTFYNDALKPALLSLYDFIGSLMGRISPELMTGAETVFDQILSNIQNSLSTISTNVLGWVGGFTAKIPSFVLAFLFTIMSSVIISTGYQEIALFIARQIPQRYKKLVFKIKDHTLGTVGKYLRAYIILITLTFIELSIGLSVLQVKNAILYAVLIALIDILPVFGCGTVLLPWVVIELARMNFPKALGLLTLYGIIAVIRNIIEPRIVGNQLGLHPLVTLICIYLGFKVIGVGGMILFPIVCQTIVSLQNDNLLHVWKSSPDDKMIKTDKLDGA